MIDPELVAAIEEGDRQQLNAWLAKLPTVDLSVQALSPVHGAEPRITCPSDRSDLPVGPKREPSWAKKNSATKAKDQLAPLHSMTSSTRARIDFGIVRPSASTALRLMTSL